MAINRFEQRKRETKAAIQEAFINLLHEKPFDEITVREIALRAKVGFKTFYRHYDDKTQLTQAIVQEYVEEVSAKLELPLSLEANLRNLRAVLAFVRESAPTMQAISRTPARDTLIQPLVQFAFAEGLRIQIAALGGDSPSDSKRRELVAHHFVHSQFSLFLWWVEHGADISVEEMEEMVSALIIRPIWNLPPHTFQE